MVEFNRKKKYKKYINSPITLAVLFVVFLILLKALWGVYTKERMSARYLNREEAELARIMERKKELAQAVEYLKTERGLEAEMRSKFRVVKEGESVAVIINDDVKVATTTATTTPGFWKRLGHFIGF